MAVKKRTEPDWQDLRMFLALGRFGSLSGAARTLRVNHATIARRIQSLEATLGDKLVERRRDGYALTPAGERMLAVTSEMEAAVQGIGRGTADGQPRGLVRVNAPPALAQGFLIAHLARLSASHPNLDVELATDLRVVSLQRREADIAVRMVRPRDSELVARRLVSVAYGFYGTRATCRAIEKGGEPVFIGFDEANAHMPESAWLAQQHPRARIAFRANHHVAHAAAAQSNAGLALVPHYVGRTHKGLQLFPGLPVPPDREAWLITRHQDRKDLPIRTAVDFLTEVFSSQRALFEA
ncbi:MAG: LysR family transcriptional regulator [Panacagrimonas sp.]|nr:LysR family transcriptional regulator [Panacagrimonas sp.]MCC2655251.1 LysR family transcriptional regulator [Panacagrimonas sp.]